MSASEEGADSGVWGGADGPTNEPVRAVLCGLELVLLLLLMGAYTDWAGSL